MDLASLALVFEKEGREEGNSTPAVKGVWGKSTYSSGSRAPNSWKQQYNRKAQFWGQDIQTLDPAGLSMDFYFIWTSQSQRACQITSLQDLFEPYFAQAFFSGFLTTEVQGAPSKSLVFLLFQRIFWSTFSFIRLFALHSFYKISWKQTFRRLFTCPWVFNDIL